jgi:MYXO-CTERM domain-containing protein
LAGNPVNPILFVTQVPMPEEVNSRTILSSSTSCVSPFGNHLGDTAHAGRGGSLFIRFSDGRHLSSSPADLRAAMSDLSTALLPMPDLSPDLVSTWRDLATAAADLSPEAIDLGQAEPDFAAGPPDALGRESNSGEPDLRMNSIAGAAPPATGCDVAAHGNQASPAAAAVLLLLFAFRRRRAVSAISR